MKILKASLLIILILYVLVLVLPFVLIDLHSLFLPNPPKPVITYGEFPFKLVYEINGEQKVIEDTVICKYDGIGIGSGSKYRKWKSRLASGNKEVVLMKVNNSKYIYYIYGYPDEYMGDLQFYEPFEASFPNANIYGEGGSRMNRLISADELLSEYGIKLISWEPSSPIVNSFK